MEALALNIEPSEGSNKSKDFSGKDLVDRAVFVSASGAVVDGDAVLLAFARALKAEGRLTELQRTYVLSKLSAQKKAPVATALQGLSDPSAVTVCLVFFAISCSPRASWARCPVPRRAPPAGTAVMP